MSKEGLEAWERVELYCENNSSLEHLLDDLEIIEKELKALEIIKKYIHIYCVAPNERGGVRIWFTQDGDYIDMPQEEYELAKEVLL